MFLDLAQLQERCETWYKKSSEAGKPILSIICQNLTLLSGKWTANGTQITLSWLKEGLKPRCITRDLKWGTPVPKAGYEKKVFYVWFDAPIGYLSITANFTSDWENWWKNPDQVQLYQFMGKDNVPFHTVIFPCSLFATKENWTLVNHINTTEYLQYEGTKFSKSRGVGVFGNNVMDSGIPVEVWRYYLFSVRPESNDSQFTWKGLIAANNNELLANLGNYVNRVTKFLAAKYEGVVPDYKYDTSDEKVISDVNALLKEYITALEAVKIRHALKLVMDISARGNQYLQDNKLDNNLFANQPERCDAILGLSVNLIYLLASLVYPYMPSTTQNILEQLNVPQPRSLAIESWDAKEILAGHPLGKPNYLFKRIEEKLEEGFKAKYGGSESAAPKDNAVAESKPSKSKKKSASAQPTLPEGFVKPQEMLDLETKITEAGELVRKLKTEKAEANAIQKSVTELLSLKAALSDMIAKATK